MSPPAHPLAEKATKGKFGSPRFGGDRAVPSGERELIQRPQRRNGPSAGSLLPLVSRSKTGACSRWPLAPHRGPPLPRRPPGGGSTEFVKNPHHGAEAIPWLRLLMHDIVRASDNGP